MQSSSASVMPHFFKPRSRLASAGWTRETRAYARVGFRSVSLNRYLHNRNAEALRSFRRAWTFMHSHEVYETARLLVMGRVKPQVFIRASKALQSCSFILTRHQPAACTPCSSGSLTHLIAQFSWIAVHS